MIYERPDSPYWWMALDGFYDANHNPLRESTRIRRDAPTVTLRKAGHAQAVRRFHERMLELAASQTGGPSRKPRIGFSDFVDWFEKHKLPARRGAERECEILPLWRKAFGSRPIHEINQKVVSEWMTARMGAPARIVNGRTIQAPQSATVNREVDLLKAILKAAVPTFLDSSPLKGMSRLRQRTPKRRLMSEDEERRLLAVMAPDDKALFLLGLDSLVRLGDLLDVTRADDHGDHLWIADPKAGGGFNVPVSARAREAIDAIPPDYVGGGRKLTDTQLRAIRTALQARPRPNKSDIAREHGVSETLIRKIERSPAPPVSAYIFWRRRQAATERDRRNGIAHMLRRYCELATPPIVYGRNHGGLSFHWATRRTGATRMLTRGSDPGTVQKVGRWKRPDVVLGIYHELIDEAARAAVESVGPREIGGMSSRQRAQNPTKTRSHHAALKLVPDRKK